MYIFSMKSFHYNNYMLLVSFKSIKYYSFLNV